MSGCVREARVAYMPIAKHTRRHFVSESGRGLAAGWLALELPWLAALSACGRDGAEDGRPLVSLTPAEARAMRAFAAQIIPSDDGSPGADEAGAVYFIDRALGLPFFADSAPIIRRGLADLDRRARALDGEWDFAGLSRPGQIALMRQIEHDPFFTTARILVVIGTFADPSHGGNAGRVGWTTIGIEHRPSYKAPFGWYDANPNGDPGPRAA
jgi:gluconate 2-dehydrogenase gamma chain